MIGKALSLFLCLSLVSGTQAVLAQAMADPEVAKGIKQAEDGDYDSAILTLDTAARRLAKDPARTKELSQAYLYLGIAYVGKGHEAAAKAKFREALDQIKDLSLSPDKFPPKVIDIFEAAKEEARTALAPPPQKKGGGHKGLWIGAGVVAAGAGIAAAAGGGGSSTTTTLPKDPRTVFNATGTTTQYSCFQGFKFVPTKSGTFEASLTWTDAAAVADLHMDLYEDQTGNKVAESNPASNTEARMSAPVTNQIYQLYVCQGGYEKPVDFKLTVRYP